MRLFSASWSVLREDKSLVLFPFISAVAGLVVIASFAIPVVALFLHVDTVAATSATSQQSSVHMDPLGWVLVGVGYFVLVYVGVFANAALIVAANERLTGTGPGSLASGFGGAWEKAGAFVPWALLSATVSVALRLVEQRMGIVGRIIVSLVGIAWNLLTYLVVPVLVLEEGLTTGRAVKRSSALFKQTWGENVIGNASFGLFTFLVVLSALALFLLGVASQSAVLVVSLGVLAAVWLVVGVEALAAMSGIYRVALYRYALDGRAPAAYGAFDFDGAFRARKSFGLFSSRETIHRPPAALSRAPEAPRWAPPPPVEVVAGEYGVEIPGFDTLEGHHPGGPAPAPAPPPGGSPEDPPG